jgi:transposase-like protein
MRANRTSEISVSNKTQALDSNDGVLPFTLTSEFLARAIAQLSEQTLFLRYPVELRKIVYTTNAIESLNAQMRKNTSNRKVFPNDEAVIKILFLNVRNLTNKWTKRHGWDIVLNQLSMIFGERLSPDIIDAM